MLTDRDRRLLREIAEGLGRDDPEFVRQFRRAGRSRDARPGAWSVAPLAAALVAMIVCAVLLLPVATLATAVAAVAILLFAAAARRRSVTSP